MATKESDRLLQQMLDIVNDRNTSTNTTNAGYTNSTTTPTSYTNTTYQPFSTLDSLNMQAKAWEWTDTDIASAYKNLANWLGNYSNTANTIADFYNTAAKQIANREWAYANASFQLADQLNNDLANQRDYIWATFWPEGSLTTEMNKYYDDMWNYLASEWGRQMAKVAAQWIHSWASLGLLRAQENEAYNNAFANYLKVKEQEINAKQQIQAQLIDYMTKLRQEYGNTTNQYILAQYQRANDLLNKLDTDLASQYTTLWLYKIQGGWGSSSWAGAWTSWAWTYTAWGAWAWAWTNWAWVSTTAANDTTNWQGWAITSSANNGWNNWIGAALVWASPFIYRIPKVWKIASAISWLYWAYKMMD